MRNKIIEFAKSAGADIVGFADRSRFNADDNVFKIMPEFKTVIGLGFRVLRGAYRGMEEGSTFYQYATMGVETMEETAMPMALLRTAVFIEDNGYIALPQKHIQQIMKEENDTNPETRYDFIYRGINKENQMNFQTAAVACGLGELGFYGKVLNEKFGPMIRFGFILTDAELEPTKLSTAHLCDKCGKCVSACPGGAIDESGKMNKWQCAAYYHGANGLINPFMTPNALEEFDDRLDILSGTAKLTPEKARAVCDVVFKVYGSVPHGYQSCLCGKACDIACYDHLLEKGALSGNSNSPFKKREHWKFDIEYFK